MYNIYKDGTLIARTDNAVYIKKHPTNDSFVPATEADADGISVPSLSEAFALSGRKLNDLESVVVVKDDAGTVVESVESNMNHIADMMDIEIGVELSTKEMAIMQTRRLLKRRLDEGLVWDDGKTYNISAEKQGFLKSQLMIGLLQIMNGAKPEEIVLQWNESGRAHTDWAYLTLVKLSFDIHNYVESLVVKQQNAEEKINEAETDKEIGAIMKSFAL
jgi:hypothetical protein